MRNDISSDFAEVLVSKDFREALNATFDQNPEQLPEIQFTAEQVVLEAMYRHKDPQERAFETRRLSALAILDETELGGFKDYLLYQKGTSKPTKLTVADLEDGEPEAIRTNSKLLTLDQTTTDPLEFLYGATAIIDERKNAAKEPLVGPENYATALKFFADKLNDQPIDETNKPELRELASHLMTGFLEISETDKPNFVELTNVYVAIRELPRGTFGAETAEPLLKHTLEQMPTFNQQTLSVLLSALAKMDLHEVPEVAGTVVDLTMRKMGAFETTRDMRRALRAISNLPASPAADESFKSFLYLRNQLEQPMDIVAMDETAARLVQIVDTVIDDLLLIPHAKAIAERCLHQAAQYLAVQKNRGAMTADQIKSLEQTVLRIRANYEAI